MKDHPNFFVLKVNRNGFPNAIPRILKYRAQNEENFQKSDFKSLQVKNWYIETFQKGNRWNKSMIRSRTCNFTFLEIKTVRSCFIILFNPHRSYNQSFIKFIDQILIEIEEEKSGKAFSKIRISQRAYYDLLQIIGDQKSDGEINNTYKQLAEIIDQSFLPEEPIKQSTIIDRLKNQKGYK